MLASAIEQLQPKPPLLCRRAMHLGESRRPLAVGWVLDFGGGNTGAAWAGAFMKVAALNVLALLMFISMRPRELPGDRGVPS